MERRRLGLGDVLLVVVVIVWGLNIPITKILLDQLEPLQVIGLRWPPVAVGLFVLLRAAHRARSVQWRDLGWLVLLAVLGVAANQFLWVSGLNQTLPSRSALIFTTSAVLAPLIAPLFGGAPLGRRGWGGVGIALFGLYIVLTKGLSIGLLASPTSRGDLLTLCSAACVALFTAASRPFIRRYGSLTFTTYALVLGTVLMLPVAGPAALRTDFPSLSLFSWACVSYTILMSGILGFACWFGGVGRIGPARTAVYQCLIPVMAVAASAVLVGDRLTVTQLIGAAIALGGVLLARTDVGATSEEA